MSFIRVQNVKKTYQAGRHQVAALRGVTTEIAAGTLTFVLGPSGSGKSTLLYLLGALDKPTDGEIFVGCDNLSSMTNRERNRYRQRRVGFIFQNFNLLATLTALDNVLVPYFPTGINTDLKRRAQNLLEQVGLGDRTKHRPSQLSGGEQQRVAIARALLKNPELVLADEPTGELDSQNGAEVYGYLREMQKHSGTTIVVVTHDKNYIKPDDPVLQIKDGLLVSTDDELA